MTADPLTPVREAVLRQAHRDAAATVSAAEQESDGILARAYRLADDLMAAAREAGRHDAEALSAADRARARRTARGIRLAAERAAYDDLHRRALEAMRGEAADPAVRQALLDRATRALGGPVSIEDLPGGGVLGSRDGHVADCSVEGLVDHAMAALAGHLPEVWS